MLQDTIQLPIIPRSKKDPTQQMRFVRSAEDVLSSAIKNIRDRYIDMFRSLKRYAITADGKIIANKQYIYDLTIDDIDSIQKELSDYVDEQLDDRDKGNWFFKDYVEQSYKRGTIAEYANLSGQSSLYASKSLGRILLDDAYKRRVALVKYRAFEEMAGLSANVKKNLSLILSDSIAHGYGIDKTVAEMMRQSSIEQFRARRMARTEILTAYRRARLDESEQAEIDYGFSTGLLWLSAFAPTSRDWHLARHGKMYTREEVRDFYSEARNSINCMCTQTSVLVGGDGEPISKALTSRMVQLAENAKEYQSKLIK